MYNSTNLSVKVGNYSTDTFSSFAGVRQGDNLSPTLFNIFINDIPSYFDSSCDPVCLTHNHISCLLYADDLVLLSNSEKLVTRQMTLFHLVQGQRVRRGEITLF